jgi:ATPase family AAA domain-containing protein 3A/B
MFGFGGGDGNKPDDKKPASNAPVANGGGGGGGGGGAGYSFDPSGLERAAAAAKELDKSRNAKEAFGLAKGQEKTKQLEIQAKHKEYEAQTKAYELQYVREKAEQDRKTLQQKQEQEKQMADYKDGLDRKRIKDKLEAEVYMRDKERQRDEERAAKLESLRRETIEYESQLRMQTELKRVEAETAGRIRQEQENKEIHLERDRLKAKEYRETVLEGVKLSGETLGAGLKDFLGDTERMTATVGGITLLALGVYSAKTATGVAGKFIEARMGKPSLVRETSRRTGLQRLNPVPVVRSMVSGQKDALDGIVLAPGLNARVRNIAISTSNTKKNQAPFRHLLLHGPPGTGKTLFAKSLAKNAGLDYAIMTGGDVAPLGRDGVTEIHKTFDWASSSNKGVLLFVDEADAFLQKRGKVSMSEDVRNALNAFLYRTGEQSDKFMLVFASNQPEQFDWAINDRIDEMVEFALPGTDERKAMLQLYLDKFIYKSGQGGGMFGGGGTKIEVFGGDKISEEKINEIAIQTDGFSGREISKLAIAWQAACYGTANPVLTDEILDTVLGHHLEQSAQKQVWYDTETPGGAAPVIDADAKVASVNNSKE